MDGREKLANWFYEKISKTSLYSFSSPFFSNEKLSREAISLYETGIINDQGLEKSILKLIEKIALNSIKTLKRKYDLVIPEYLLFAHMNSSLFQTRKNRRAFKSSRNLIEKMAMNHGETYEEFLSCFYMPNLPIILKKHLLNPKEGWPEKKAELDYDFHHACC